MELKYVAGAGALTTLAVLFMIFNAAGGTPVSYTHLDVYKRQVQ